MPPVTEAKYDAPFKPAWWLRNSHSQTLYRKFSAISPVEHRRQRLELADGDFIDLDWAVGAAEQQCTQQADPERIVLILHGLCGCSQSSYVLALQSMLHRHRVASVAMNLRSCSGEVNRLARTYHSGASADLDEVYSALREQYPHTGFAVVGYSLGANVVLKWLGESGTQPQLDAAVAVSTPFQLADCSRAMLSGLSRMYGRYFVGKLQTDLDKKQAYFRAHDQTGQLQRLQALALPDRFKSIWDFDDRVTAPLHGFKDAQDYYTRCSSAGFLSGIGTETLLIHSADDPLIPAGVIPRPSSLPDCVRLHLSSNGGHVGFITGRQSQWLEQSICRFLSV